MVVTFAQGDKARDAEAAEAGGDGATVWVAALSQRRSQIPSD